MLFDVDPKLIRTLAREQKVGLRDCVIKPKALGPNDITYVGAKSMRGLEFVKFLEEKLPKVVMDFDLEDEEEDEEDLDEEETEDEEDEDELDEDEDELGEG